MRKLVLFIVPLALLVAEDKPAAKAKSKARPQTQTQTAAQPAPASGSITIPADAVQLAPQVYRHKDAAGKTWIYRQTPFGISKMEERVFDPAAISSAPAGAPAPAPAQSKIKVNAIDRGDTVRFEQLTPMGNRVWERKKSELTPEEKAWLERKDAVKDSSKPEN